MAHESRARSGSAGIDDPKTAMLSTQKGIFRREGEFWTVGYGGKAFRLKDTKGLGYLAHLLRHPATEFHVLDLAGGISDQPEVARTGRSAKGSRRAMPASEKFSRDLSRRAASAPTILTPIFRLSGNSRRQMQIRLSNPRRHRPQMEIPLPRVPNLPIVRRTLRWSWKFLRSRLRSGLPL